MNSNTAYGILHAAIRAEVLAEAIETLTKYQASPDVSRYDQHYLDGLEDAILTLTKLASPESEGDPT